MNITNINVLATIPSPLPNLLLSSSGGLSIAQSQFNGIQTQVQSGFSVKVVDTTFLQQSNSQGFGFALSGNQKVTLTNVNLTCDSFKVESLQNDVISNILTVSAVQMAAPTVYSTFNAFGSVSLSANTINSGQTAINAGDGISIDTSALNSVVDWSGGPPFSSKPAITLSSQNSVTLGSQTTFQGDSISIQTGATLQVSTTTLLTPQLSDKKFSNANGMSVSLSQTLDSSGNSIAVDQSSLTANTITIAGSSVALTGSSSLTFAQAGTSSIQVLGRTGLVSFQSTDVTGGIITVNGQDITSSQDHFSAVKNEYNFQAPIGFDDFQLTFNAVNSLGLTDLNAKSFNTQALGSTIACKNLTMKRHKTLNNNLVIFNASNSLNMNLATIESSSTVLIGTGSVSLTDTQLPDMADEDNTKIHSISTNLLGGFSSAILSNGQVELLCSTYSNFQMFPRDMHLTGATLHSVNLSLTIKNQNPIPVPNILVEIGGNYLADGLTVINGYRMNITAGSLNFPSQLTLTSEAKTNGLSSALRVKQDDAQHIYIGTASEGSFSCGICQIYCDSIEFISGGISINSLDLQTFNQVKDFSIKVLSLSNFDVTSSLTIKGKAAIIQAVSMSFKSFFVQTVTSNFGEEHSLQDNNPTLNILASGLVSLDTGKFDAQSIWIEADTLSMVNTILNANRKQNSNNLLINCLNQLISNSNLTIIGGIMKLQGASSLLFQSTVSITQIQSLIGDSALMKGKQSHLVEPTLSFSSTGPVTLADGNIGGQQIGITSGQLKLSNIVFQDVIGKVNPSSIIIQSTSDVTLLNGASLTFDTVFIASQGSVALMPNTIISCASILNSMQPQLEIVTLGSIGIQNVQINVARSTLFNSSGDIGIHNSKLSLGSQLPEIFTRFIAKQGQVVIDQTSTVSSARMLLLAGTQLIVDTTSTITSKIQNTCTTEHDGVKPIACFPKSSTDSNVSESSFLKSYNDQFNQQATSIDETFGVIQNNYTIFFMSYGKISVNSGSKITGSRIQMCSTSFSLLQSSVTAKGWGCPSDTGLGTPLKQTQCAGAGAGHAGEGGPGAESRSGTFGRCFSKGEVYVQENYEGSGGASNGDLLGGNGGGMIQVFASNNTLLVDSTIDAKGQNAQNPPASQNGDFVAGAGGGSGGSVFIGTNKISGNGNIQVDGGSGSASGGGGGGGGNMVINYLGNYLNNFQEGRSQDWSGKTSINHGLSGEISPAYQYNFSQYAEDGNVYTPACLPGYSGGLCDPCPVGKYKYDYSYGSCSDCDNKPELAYYIGTAMKNASCNYECIDGIESKRINEDCLSQFDLQFQRLTGSVSALVGTAAFLFFSFIFWMALILRSGVIKKQASEKRIKDYYKLYTNEADQAIQRKISIGSLKHTDDPESEKRPLKVIKVKDVQMAEQYLWYQLNRVYLMGNNSVAFPWIFPTEIPSISLRENRLRKLRDLAKNPPNVSFRWYRQLLYVVLRIVYPPIADRYLHRMKRINFESLNQIVIDLYEPEFWEDNFQSQSIRIYGDQRDYTIMALDFLDFSRSPSNYPGPRLPMTTIISGTGSFNEPYILNYEGDPYIKSIMLVNRISFKDKLPLFIENLNTLLRRLSFYNFTKHIKRDLDAILEHLDFGNEKLFYRHGVKLTLHLFENTYNKENKKVTQTRRSSFPIDTKLMHAFKRTFDQLIQYVKLRTLSGKTEIRLGLVVSKTNIQTAIDARKASAKEASKQLKTVEEQDGNLAFDDVDQVREASQNYKINFSYHRESTLLADMLSEEDYQILNDDDQSDSKGDQLQFENNLKKTFDHIVLKQDSQESLITTQRKESTKAFSVSKESVKSLELSMKKDRSKCKHKCTRLRGHIYSAYFLLFNFTSLPPSQSFYTLFFSYATVISIELLLSGFFFLHIIFPIAPLQKDEFGNPLPRQDNPSYTIAIVYMSLYPLAPLISAVLAIVSTLTANVKLMQAFVEFNSLLCRFNYPATIITQIVMQDQATYMLIIVALFFNKILISFFGAKIRSGFQNPHYSKNIDKIQNLLLEELKNEEYERDKGGELSPRYFESESLRSQSREDFKRVSAQHILVLSIQLRER